MAIVAYFPPGGMNREQYDAARRQLEEEGGFPPQGLLRHVCFGSSDELGVFEIWESEEAMQRFGETLERLLEEHGIDPGEPPQIYELQSEVAG